MTGTADTAKEEKDQNKIAVPAVFLGYENEFNIAMEEIRGESAARNILFGIIRDGFYRTSEPNNTMCRCIQEVLGTNDAVRVIDMQEFRRNHNDRSDMLRELLTGYKFANIHHAELMSDSEIGIMLESGCNVVYSSTHPLPNSVILNLYSRPLEQSLATLTKKGLVSFESSDVRPLSGIDNIRLSDENTFLKRYETEVPGSYEILQVLESHRSLNNIFYSDPGYCTSNWGTIVDNYFTGKFTEPYISYLKKVAVYDWPEEDSEDGMSLESGLMLLCRVGNMFHQDNIATIFRISDENDDRTSEKKVKRAIDDLVAWGIIFRHNPRGSGESVRYSMSDYVRRMLFNYGLKSESLDEEVKKNNKEKVRRNVRSLLESILEDETKRIEAYRDPHMLCGLMESYIFLTSTGVPEEETFTGSDKTLKLILDQIPKGFFTYRNPETSHVIRYIYRMMRRTKYSRKMDNGTSDTLDKDELEVCIRVTSRYISELVNGNDPSKRTEITGILEWAYDLLRRGLDDGSEYGKAGVEDLDWLSEFIRCQAEMAIFTMHYTVPNDSDVSLYRKVRELLVKKKHGMADDEPMTLVRSLGLDRQICDMLQGHVYTDVGEDTTVFKRLEPCRLFLTRFLADVFGPDFATEGFRIRTQNIRDLYLAYEFMRQKCGVMKTDGPGKDHPLYRLGDELERRFTGGKKDFLCEREARVHDYVRFITAKYGAYNIMKNHGFTKDDKTLETLDVGWILRRINSEKERSIVEQELSIQNAFQYVDNRTLYNVEHTLEDALNSTDACCKAMALDCLGVAYGQLGNLRDSAESYLRASECYTLAGRTALSILMRARASQTALRYGDIKSSVVTRKKAGTYLRLFESDAPLTYHMLRVTIADCY